MASIGASCALAAESWSEELAAEIGLAETCEVDFLTQVTDREVNGVQIIFAKVHCRDGRVFDATRTGAFEPFDFKICPAAREVQSC